MSGQILVAPGPPRPIRGEIEEAQDAEAAVEQETPQVRNRLTGLGLEQIVHEAPGFAEIAEEVADSPLDRVRRHPIIGHGHRPQHPLIGFFVESVSDSIDPLELIFFRRLRRIARAGCQKKYHKKGADDGGESPHAEILARSGDKDLKINVRHPSRSNWRCAPPADQAAV